MIARVSRRKVTHDTLGSTLNRIRTFTTCSRDESCDGHHRSVSLSRPLTVVGVNNCVFCAIVAGEAPSTTVLDTEDVVAFLDIRPIARGHVLVIPKQHSTDLDSMEPALGGAVFAAGQRISRAIRRSDLRSDGANLVVNDGKAAFQTVFHTHLHIVPRWTGDKLRFAGGFLTRRLREPEHTAAAIREGLERLAAEEVR